MLKKKKTLSFYCFGIDTVLKYYCRGAGWGVREAGWQHGWRVASTKLERWREQGHPCAVRPALPAMRHHWASSFSGNGAIGSSCAAYCLLHTSVRCRVNKQLSECSHVTGMHAGALYQSFFSTILNYSRNRGRERAKLFFISLSLSLSPPLSHTRTHTHTHTHTHVD